MVTMVTELSEVATVDGRHRLAYFINDQMPGPSIVVYKGQQVDFKIFAGLLIILSTIDTLKSILMFLSCAQTLLPDKYKFKT